MLAGEIPFPDETLNEFKDVIFRKKLDKYFASDAARLKLLNEIDTRKQEDAIAQAHCETNYI